MPSLASSITVFSELNQHNKSMINFIKKIKSIFVLISGCNYSAGVLLPITSCDPIAPIPSRHVIRSTRLRASFRLRLLSRSPAAHHVMWSNRPIPSRHVIRSTRLQSPAAAAAANIGQLKITRALEHVNMFCSPAVDGRWLIAGFFESTVLFNKVEPENNNRRNRIKEM